MINLRDVLNIFSDSIINELEGISYEEGDGYKLDFSYEDPELKDYYVFYSIYLYTSDFSHSLNIKFNGQNNYNEEMVVDYHIAEMYLNVINQWENR